MVLPFPYSGGRRTVTREQLEESVEEVTIGDKFTGQFRVNYNILVDVEKCVRMAQARYSVVYINNLSLLISQMVFKT